MKRKTIALAIRSPFCPQLGVGDPIVQYTGRPLYEMLQQLVESPSPAKRPLELTPLETGAKRTQHGTNLIDPPITPPHYAPLYAVRNMPNPPKTPARTRRPVFLSDSPTVGDLRNTGVFSPKRCMPGFSGDADYEVSLLGQGDFHLAVEYQNEHGNPVVVRYLNTRFAAYGVQEQKALFENAWGERELLLRHGLPVADVKIDKDTSIQERFWVVEKLSPLDSDRLSPDQRQAGLRWLMELATKVWAQDILCIPDFKPANVGYRVCDGQYVLLDHREKPIDLGEEVADLNQLITLWGFSDQELKVLEAHFLSVTKALPADSRIKQVVLDFQNSRELMLGRR